MSQWTTQLQEQQSSVRFARAVLDEQAL